MEQCFSEDTDGADADSESGGESCIVDDDDFYQAFLSADEENSGEDDQSLTSTQFSSGEPFPLPTSSSIYNPLDLSLDPSSTFSIDESTDPTHLPLCPKTPSSAHSTSSPNKDKAPRKRVRENSESETPSRPKLYSEHSRWNGPDDPDTAPQPKKFLPKRRPGAQLDPSCTYSPLALFSLFLDRSSISILCCNTNEQACKNIAKGKKYHWSPVTEEDMYKYLGLTFYFSLVKLSSIPEYWRQNTIFSQVFPAKVLTRERYLTISWNLHLSDPNEDLQNDEKKGTSQYDPLFRLKPLLDTIKTACQTYYHPRQNISIDERMVATKACNSMKQYLKMKPSKYGFKLFVLADSYNGYTLDFNIFTGHTPSPSGHGLPYDAVMALLDPSFLGSGYHLYVDNFYTSPKLFKDLYDMKIGACGTYRENRKDCPQAPNNALTKKDPRGTLRWIREGPLVFVKWMDSKEISICSTIHPAFSGDTVMRRTKNNDGKWISHVLTCPSPIIEYNKHIGGVDLSDQLLLSYSVHWKTLRWYRTFFLHFLDIAATNAYLLHKDLCREKKQKAMTHRQFVAELSAQLCGVTVKSIPETLSKGCVKHLPVMINQTPTERSKLASAGRKICVYCRKTTHKKNYTPWKCEACGVALCLIGDRNCFHIWHQKSSKDLDDYTDK